MIGETTNGRSISASRTPRPRALPRASTSAQPTPKIVLSGTAIAAIRTVNQNALTAAGVVIQSQAWLMPCSNVRMNTTPSGRRRSTPRYRSAAPRRERVAGRLSRTATPQPAKGEQDEQRDDEQHNRQR